MSFGFDFEVFVYLGDRFSAFNLPFAILLNTAEFNYQQFFEQVNYAAKRGTPNACKLMVSTLRE